MQTAWGEARSGATNNFLISMNAIAARETIMSEILAKKANGLLELVVGGKTVCFLWWEALANTHDSINSMGVVTLTSRPFWGGKP